MLVSPSPGRDVAVDRDGPCGALQALRDVTYEDAVGQGIAFVGTRTWWHADSHAS